MLLFDSHVHLDFDALVDDPAVLARAFAAGIRRVLVPGVDPAQWARALTLRPGPLEVWFAAGLHPCFSGDLTQLEGWVDRLGAVAIGECGWDRRAPHDDALVDAQIELARARGLPLVLHVVGAHGHAIERLERHGTLRGVVHAYSGSAELVRAYVGLGLHVSIGPSVLRDGARKVRLAAAAVPADRLLIETDAPDQIDEPADLLAVARAVAALRGVPVSELAASTFANADALFSPRSAA